jgi:hypothetical protein
MRQPFKHCQSSIWFVDCLYHFLLLLGLSSTTFRRATEITHALQSMKMEILTRGMMQTHRCGSLAREYLLPIGCRHYATVVRMAVFPSSIMSMARGYLPGTGELAMAHVSLTHSPVMEVPPFQETAESATKRDLQRTLISQRGLLWLWRLSLLGGL